MNTDQGGSFTEIIRTEVQGQFSVNISNTGTSDMVTFMWANEPFNNDKPDTIYEEV